MSSKLNLFYSVGKYSLVWIFTASILFSSTHSENILVLCPLSSKSHKNFIQPLVDSLAERGHTITVVSSYPAQIPRENVRELAPILGFDYLPNFNPFKERRFGYIGLYLKGFQHFYDACDQIHRNENFLQLQSEKFDLVLVDALLNGCMQGLIYVLKTPFIFFSPLPAPNFVTVTVGVTMPPSFVPMIVTGYSDEMNLFERMHNFLLHLGQYKIRSEWATNYEFIYRKYLGSNIPGMKTLEENVSLIFSNSGFLEYPRPVSNQIIQVGGIHCREGRILAQQFKSYVEDNPNGFILVSFGSVVKSEDVDRKLFQTFLNVFSRLKLNVIWKWDLEYEEIIPKNVKLVKWLPLQDLLAHSNIKLFITHGGLLSSQEAVYHGAPMIGIPLFADQDMNVKITERAGVSIYLELLELDERNFEEAINKILNNSTFKQRAVEMSRLARHQLQSPLERAVYWAEYVLRHKGAHHLRFDVSGLSDIHAPESICSCFLKLAILFVSVIFIIL